ncbi:GLUG motif-containing protein [Marinomonas spartinae]|uniref:GLUG motif-containing protein n=1 Tax=Marinomonas spartinae TaxID=1792290 RepID=UPI0018F1AD35|nr:GLUG motif-containing protein [Marinomonas spartinae]MBJ7556301.1 filamentous hemagglutinin N-terminal domain-containing protein [Marinomonas spartinae]
MGIQKYEVVTLSGQTRRCVVGVLIYFMTVQPVLAAATLPTGGSVAAGQVSMGTLGNTTTVTQRSDKAIVNWQSFSVGKGASVHFIQPDSRSAILNRVTGATTSTIAGSIHANGQVYLINPNGIAITSTGSVKVGGGFVASTLNIADKDFLKGHFLFKGTGASAGVSNAGIITVGRGGYAALIGGRVKNSGLIAAPLGRIGVGAGEEATLNLSGDGFLQVALPSKTDANGQDALIDNSGTLSANGGTVLISVASARNAARHVVNLSGVVEANSVSGHDGKILIGGGQGGNVTVSGQVTATSDTGKGGQISVTGQHIALNGATIDASGATGGGSVKIGGAYQGKGNTQRAKTTTVDASSVIRADASQSGDGGQVVVWSNDLTTFDGQISARGAGAGKGGDAEVSGKATLAYNGFTDLSGPGGFGTLLLDPYNITISSDTASNSSSTSATGDDSVINVGTLQTALDSANVAITTGSAGSAGSQAGDITVANEVTWNSGSTLELSAYHNIHVNAALTGGAGSKIVLRSDNSGTGTGTVTFGSGITATAPGGVAIYYNPSSYTAATDYSGNMGSDTTATAYMLVNTLDNLQAINTNLTGTYALSKDIDASATSSWNNGAGFVPLSNYFTTQFTGTFDGQSHVISNLTIHRPSTDFVGLFGNVDSGVAIRNVGLEGGSISGQSSVGSLVGYAEDGSTIKNAYATGAVTGSSYGVGGLVGRNDGTISNAYATGAVTGTGAYSNVGGLVGRNDGTISNAYATGAVKGNGTSIGGLVGENFSTISNAYATGAVTGNSNVGGLVGQNFSTISNTYATGFIKASGDNVGGLVGYNYNSSTTITSSYWDTDTTDKTSSAGGTGLTTAQMRDSANHSSNYSNWDFTDTWYQAADMRPILRSEAASPNPQGVITVSNLHQLALINANLSGNYILTGNIDASATQSTADASGIWGSGGFVPLGNYSNEFTGTFDGQSHVISDLTINRPSTGFVGLFGDMGSGGTIRNVGLEGGSILGQSSVGGLVGFADDGSTIKNAYATGAVTGSSYGVGGLVGGNDGTISNAYATGSVTGTGAYSNVGGLVGRNDGTISNAYATGAVKGIGGNDSPVGGLVGVNFGTISNAYATGVIKASGDGESVGGLAGYNNGTITSSYWDTDTTGLSKGIGTDKQSSSTTVTGLTTTEARDSSNYTYTGWDFTDSGTWYQAADMRPILRSEAASPNAEGVITVSNLHQLALINTNLSGTYQLTRNIDASVTNASSKTYSASSIWGRGGFVPLGEVPASSDYNSAIMFMGTFDGQSHVISNLTINRPSTGGVGLFGGVGLDGAVRNVGLEDCSISGQQYVGGLVGGNAGTVSNVYVTGVVTGTGTNYYVGGLVGGNVGTINNAYATGAVTGSNYYVGGLVGGNQGTISNAYAAGAVQGANDYVGGLVGVNAGTINNAYATGKVTGIKDYVGGLVGGNGGSISNTYATGEVNGDSAVGGLLGGNYHGGTVNHSYWDTDNASQPQGIGIDENSSAATVTGLTTAEMKDSSNFTGFDWTIWAPADASHRPELYGVSGVVGYVGSMVYGATSPTITTYGAGVWNTVSGTPVISGSPSATSNVGTYTGNVSGVSGTFMGGGATRFVSFTNVTPAELTVTANNGNMVYGDNVPALSYQVSGWQNGQGNSLLSGVAVATNATGTSNVGTNYTTTASDGTLTGAAKGNYTVHYVAGTFEVTPADLTVTANNGNMVYGDNVLTLGYKVSGWKNSQDNSLLSGVTVATDATRTSNVGTDYTTTASGGTLTSAAKGNYTVHYVTGKFEVNPADLTVTANNATKTYDGLAYSGGNGVTYKGFVNNETRSALGGKLVYGGSSQGAINVGNYTIDVSGLTSGNYAITYVPGQLTVNAVPNTQPNITSNIRPDASLSVNQPISVPVGYWLPSVGRQSVTDYPNGASSTGANTNGQGVVMSTQNVHLSGAVCFSGSDNAISCSAN